MEIILALLDSSSVDKYSLSWTGGEDGACNNWVTHARSYKERMFKQEKDTDFLWCRQWTTFLLAENEESFIQQFVASLYFSYPEVSPTYLIGASIEAVLLWTEVKYRKGIRWNMFLLSDS